MNGLRGALQQAFAEFDSIVAAAAKCSASLSDGSTKTHTQKQIDAFIEPIIQQFQELYPNVQTVAQLCAVLSGLRNRCAHIELTTGDLGISHPEAELEELYKALPVLKRVAIQCVRVKYPDSHLRFAATPEESATDFAQMERDGKVAGQ